MQRRCLDSMPILRRLSAPLVLLLVVTAGLLVAPGAPAFAATPRAVSGPLTDEAGVLDAREREAAEQTLRRVQQQGVDLHVLFVRSTQDLPVTSYAREVARASSMGGDDALLVVAFADRTYALWVGDRLAVGTAEVEQILDTVVAPRLRDGDEAGAIAAAGEALLEAAAAGGGTSGREDTVPGARRDPGRETSRRGIPLLPLILLGIGVVFLLSRRRDRREARAGRERQQRRLDELAAEANAALVRVDDELRDAEHEAGFAEAQFGPEEGALLREGLEQARAELQQAFAIRQRLDDAHPEAPREVVALLEEINARTGRAEQVLQERLDRLEELRGIERDPARAVRELRTRLASAEQRLPSAQATLSGLASGASRVVDAVDGNIAEAEKRLDFARGQLAEFESGGAERPPVQTLRAAGVALAQAEELLDAVDDLAERTRRAQAELPRELREAEVALAHAEDFIRSRRHVVGREARTRLVEARRRYEEARRLAASDPAAAAIEADNAERLADEAFELAARDSQDADGGGYGGGIRGFGWGVPIAFPFPFPMGGGIGWGGTSWGGGGFGGTVGGGGFGGGSVGGGRW